MFNVYFSLQTLSVPEVLTCSKSRVPSPAAQLFQHCQREVLGKANLNSRVHSCVQKQSSSQPLCTLYHCHCNIVGAGLDKTQYADQKSGQIQCSRNAYFITSILSDISVNYKSMGLILQCLAPRVFISAVQRGCTKPPNQVNSGIHFIHV